MRRHLLRPSRSRLADICVAFLDIIDGRLQDIDNVANFQKQKSVAST